MCSWFGGIWVYGGALSLYKLGFRVHFRMGSTRGREWRARIKRPGREERARLE